jgi:hypothetical protein
LVYRLILGAYISGFIAGSGLILAIIATIIIKVKSIHIINHGENSEES